MLLICALLVIAQLPQGVTVEPPPRVMKRARKRIGRTRLATLNCRTLLDDSRLDDLDVTLMDQNISICALQETRRDGCLSVSTDNYKIYWYGECSGYCGVGFAVHKKFVHLVKEVRGIPNSNGRLMTMDVFLHDKDNSVTLISAYAPPNTALADTRKKFYSQLRTIVTPSSWLMGDFNARVGRRTGYDVNFETIEIFFSTVGPWSLKGDIVPNANGSLLIDIASEKNLRHLSSHFSIRDSKRWTWKHPRYHTRAVLDHIFAPAPNMRFISRYFVAPGTTVVTDHRIAVCEVSFKPRLRKNTQPRSPPLDTRALYNQETCRAFQLEIANILSSGDPEQLDGEELSERVRSAPVSAAVKVLPRKTKGKFPVVFSPDTIALI